MRTTSIFALALTLTLVPATADAAVAKTFCELVKFLVNIFNLAAGMFVLAAFATYMYSISMNIKTSSESKSTNLRNILGWGLLALFIMVSIWGILRILQSTLTVAAPVGAQQGQTCI